ncbi:hypothetical protein R3P38DRAFT_3195165 [Favolaschia claudopus]|uniref:Uncharacterized protein n=1 Tax=Favolaschia claudopus TaxID=2862362 RepID=A0AAW0BBG5_9AGAR
MSQGVPQDRFTFPGFQLAIELQEERKYSNSKGFRDLRTPCCSSPPPMLYTLAQTPMEDAGASSDHSMPFSVTFDEDSDDSASELSDSEDELPKVVASVTKARAASVKSTAASKLQASVHGLREASVVCLTPAIRETSRASRADSSYHLLLLAERYGDAQKRHVYKREVEKREHFSQQRKEFALRFNKVKNVVQTKARRKRIDGSCEQLDKKILEFFEEVLAANLLCRLGVWGLLAFRDSAVVIPYDLFE